MWLPGGGASGAGPAGRPRGGDCGCGRGHGACRDGHGGEHGGDQNGALGGIKIAGGGTSYGI